MALSASNLGLVLFTCRQIDPVDLFNPNNPNVSPLTQPIILSLVQQLSQNLREDTEIKTKYVSIPLMDFDFPIERDAFFSGFYTIRNEYHIYS